MISTTLKLNNLALLKLGMFSLQAILLVLVAPLQIDPHHDGIILGSAIASADGYVGPAGAFSQYGPLPPLIHGLFLNLTDSTMLNLRFFAAINVLLISFLLHQVMLKIASNKVALTTSGAWVFTSAIWTTSFPGALLPWPSLIATALILASIDIFVKDFTSVKAISKLDGMALFFAGIFLGLTGFARQQTWIAVAIGFILLLSYYRSINRKLILFALGVSTSLAVMFGWLVGSGSWNAYVNQVIIWPLSAYSTLGMNNNYNRYQFASYLIQSVVFAAVIYCVAKMTIRLKSSVATNMTLGIICLVIVMLGLWIARQSAWNATIRVIIGEPMEKLLLSFLYFSCVASIVLTVYSVMKIRLLSPRTIKTSAIALFGMVGVIQLYPQPDVLHLWWVAPLFIPCGYLGYSWLTKKIIGANDEVFVRTLSISSIVGILLAINFAMQPWKEYSIPVLKGTYALSPKVESINSFTGVQKYIKPGVTSFDCADGVYSVFNGKYNPPDEWFVDWGRLNSEDPEVGQIRIICNKSEEYAQSEATRLKMRIETRVLSEDSLISFAVLVGN